MLSTGPDWTYLHWDFGLDGIYVIWFCNCWVQLKTPKYDDRYPSRTSPILTWRGWRLAVGMVSYR